MKKLMSIFAACLFVFALASCGGEPAEAAHGEEGHTCDVTVEGCDGYVAPAPAEETETEKK